MGFILSAIRPPEGEAKYGKAVTPEQEPFESVGAATQMVIWTFSNLAFGDATIGEAREVGREVMESPGREFRHSGTGLTFRVDKAEDAPHPCPCCGRLVLPDVHAYAHDKNAFCLGCFTWDRNVDGCLPENSAHATKDE